MKVRNEYGKVDVILSIGTANNQGEIDIKIVDDYGELVKNFKIKRHRVNKFKFREEKRMVKKFVVGKTENNNFFVRRVDSKIILDNLAYPIKPTSKESCIKKLTRLVKKYPSILVLHDGLCGTIETHQECIKLIIEAINLSEDIKQYGDGELLEFHDSINGYQFIVGRPEVSKAMIANNDNRTVEAMLEDYYSDFDEADYIYGILSKSDICMYRQLREE